MWGSAFYRGFAAFFADTPSGSCSNKARRSIAGTTLERVRCRADRRVEHRRIGTKSRKKHMIGKWIVGVAAAVALCSMLDMARAQGNDANRAQGNDANKAF